MSANFTESRSLAQLRAGEVGLVRAPEPGDEIPRRLQDLGFVPGTRLRVVRRAPLGDPVEVELRGYRLCLRTEQLLSIRVEPEGEGQ